jgi:hypothetical protein
LPLFYAQYVLVRKAGVACIVTIFCAISQPLFGQVHEALDASLLDRRVAELRDRSVELPSARSDEHRFYPDILIPSADVPELLIVADLTVDTELFRALALLESPSTAILFLAPRTSVSEAASVAVAPIGIPNRVPRIIVGTADTTEWIVGVPGTITPLWLARTLRSVENVRLSSGRLNAAYLGFGRSDALLGPLLDANLAAARLDLDQPDRLQSIIDAVHASLPSGESRPRDRSYLMIPGRRSPILSEPLLVWSLAVVAIGLLLFAVARPRRVKRYVTAIGHQAGLIIVLFLLLLVSLMASNLVLRVLLRIPQIADETLLLALGKLATGLIVLALLFRAIHPRVGRPSTAFTGAAILFLVMGSIVSAVFSIPVSAFFVLMTLFGFLFSLSAYPPIKAVFFLLTLIPGLYLLFGFTALADSAMTRALLTPPIWREILTAIFVFPILLMFFRLDIITPQLPLLVVVAMLATVGLALISATMITVAAQPREVRITVEERRVADSSPEVVITSDVAFDGIVSVSLPDGEILSCDRSPCVRERSGRDAPFSLQLSRSSLLDRDAIDWRIEVADRGARTYQIRIDADQEIQLYASDVPSQLNPVGSTARRFLLTPGPYPPDPYTGSVVVRGGETPVRVVVTVTAEFPGTGVDILGSSDRVSLDSYAVYWSETETIEVGGR